MRSTFSSLAFAALVPLLTVTAAPIGTDTLQVREPCEVGECPDMYGGYEEYGERGHLDEKRTIPEYLNNYKNYQPGMDREKRNNPAYLNHYKNYNPGMDREKRDAQDDPINLSDTYLACYAAYEGWQHDKEDGGAHAIEKRDEFEKRCGKLKRDPQEYDKYKPVTCYWDYDGGVGGGDGGDGGAGGDGGHGGDGGGGGDGGDGGKLMEKRAEFEKRCGKFIRSVEAIEKRDPTNIIGSYHSSYASYQTDGGNRVVEKREPPIGPTYKKYPHGPLDPEKRTVVLPHRPIDPPDYEEYPPGPDGPTPDPEKRSTIIPPKADIVDVPINEDYGDYDRYGPPLPEKRSPSEIEAKAALLEHAKRQDGGYGVYRVPVCDAGTCYTTYGDGGAGGEKMEKREAEPDWPVSPPKERSAYPSETEAKAALLEHVKRQDGGTYTDYHNPVCDGGMCYIQYGDGGSKKNIQKREAEAEAQVKPISIPDTYQACYNEYGTEYKQDEGHNIERRCGKV